MNYGVIFPRAFVASQAGNLALLRFGTVQDGRREGPSGAGGFPGFHEGAL